jgi:hypothetical protein
MSPLAALALAALLTQAPTSAPAPAPGERDYNAPPKGTPADQQLWRDLRAATTGAVLHMARIAQCSYRLTYGKYYQGLDAIAADTSAPDRDRARALRAGIESAAKAADEALPEQPGIRECRYALRDLDLAMPLAPTEPRAAQSLEEARSEGRKCVKQLTPMSETLRARADALEAALAAADEFAGRRGTPLVTLGTAAGEAKEPSAAPQPAGATPGPSNPEKP